MTRLLPSGRSISAWLVKPLLFTSLVMLAVFLVSSDPPPASASPCSGYYSAVSPPTTIRIYHNNPNRGADYQLYTRDFKTYVKESLPWEWDPDWLDPSLQAGAMSVRNYAWFWVNNWRK